MAKPKLTKDVTIRPGYDRRAPDPKKNYGIHGCELLMVRRGKKGAVQFLAFTDWTPRAVQEERMEDMRRTDVVGVQPMGADLGYHSIVPQYEGQQVMDCNLLKGKKCYYDGSSLNADRVIDILLTKGSDGVWDELEGYYIEIFGENE